MQVVKGRDRRLEDFERSTELNWLKLTIPPGLQVLDQGNALGGYAYIRIGQNKLMKRWRRTFFFLDQYSIRFYDNADQWRNGEKEKKILPLVTYTDESEFTTLLSPILTQASSEHSKNLFTFKMTVHDNGNGNQTRKRTPKTRHKRNLSSPASMLSVNNYRKYNRRKRSGSNASNMSMSSTGLSHDDLLEPSQPSPEPVGSFREMPPLINVEKVRPISSNSITSENQNGSMYLRVRSRSNAEDLVPAQLRAGAAPPSVEVTQKKVENPIQGEVLSGTVQHVSKNRSVTEINRAGDVSLFFKLPIVNVVAKLGFDNFETASCVRLAMEELMST